MDWAGGERIRLAPFWDERGYFHSEAGPEPQAVHHRHPAAERDRGPAPGARPQQHAARHPDPLAADAGLQRPVDARHRPRRHRHAGRGRTPAASRKKKKTRHDLGREELVEAHLGMEGQIRSPHPRPAQADGLQLRLAADALHARSDLCPGRARDVLQACSRTA